MNGKIHGRKDDRAAMCSDNRTKGKIDAVLHGLEIACFIDHLIF